MPSKHTKTVFGSEAREKLLMIKEMNSTSGASPIISSFRRCCWGVERREWRAFLHHQFRKWALKANAAKMLLKTEMTLARGKKILFGFLWFCNLRGENWFANSEANNWLRSKRLLIDSDYFVDVSSGSCRVSQNNECLKNCHNHRFIKVTCCGGF